jgi:hypothetical protein
MNHRTIDAAQYIAFGYPSRTLKREQEDIVTKAVYLQMQPVQDKVYTYYGFDTNFFIGLEMKGRGIDVRSGEKSEKLKSQVGMSGGGLWLIQVTEEDSKVAIDFNLIGIMTDERTGKYHCLIANRIDSIIYMVAQLENNTEAKHLAINSTKKYNFYLRE